MINVNAEIIPWKSIGGIKLYTHIKDLQKIIQGEHAQSSLYDLFLVRYEIEGKLYLFFNLLNGKLFKITALKGYKGTLYDKIKIGTKEDSLSNIDPRFEYDDFEEVYENGAGVFIETDPITEKVQWISIFVKELERMNFTKAIGEVKIGHNLKSTIYFDGDLIEIASL